ncbi:MAG: autotransporter outer membrane beta-barrel domain-containing protein [Novosphingobium sp.]|jgi:fibronectin-binding autotransporter adhesin|nr:autotransporter outer membrane beta-barrel domain-containing protein [Novosphingobium sp.]
MANGIATPPGGACLHRGSGRNGFAAPANRPRAGALFHSTALIGLLAALPLAAPARAQTYVVPNATNINNATTTPANNSTFQLDGNAGITAPVILASIASVGNGGTATIDFDAASGSSTITASLGGKFVTTGTNPNQTSAIVNLKGGDFTFTGVATGNGGAGGLFSTGRSLVIHALNGSLTIQNSSVTNTAGATQGGAVSSTVLSIDSAGGAITIKGNSANGTGSANSYGGAFYSTSSVTVGSATSGAVLMEDNHAGTNTSVTGEAQGGVINAQANITVDSASTITIRDNTVANGVTNYGSGGALTSQIGNVTIGSATSGAVDIENNHAYSRSPAAGGAGGAIKTWNNNIVATAGTVTVDSASGITIKGNTASNAGGAISAEGAVIIGASTHGAIAIENNSVTNGDGGAIDAKRNVTIGNAASTLTLSHNIAGSNGGAIYAHGVITITADALTATDNSAGSSSGGAIVSDSANGGVSITATAGDIVLSRNTAAVNGGAIASFTAGDVTLAAANGRVEFSDNTGDTGAGGAINASNAVITLTGKEVALTGNRSGTSGGAIFASASSGNLSAVNIGNAGSIVTITGNTAGLLFSGALGGAILSRGPVTLTGSTIDVSDNQAGANGSGGAIYVNGGNLTVSGALTANANRAGIDGGAFIVAAGDFLQDGGDVRMGDTAANKASNGSGGAIYAGSDVSLAATSGNVTLANNIAGIDGGAIYADGAVKLGNAAGTLTLSGNTAAGGNGGAIYAGANVTLWGTDISNNSAAGNGGAIYTAADFTLNATTDDTVNTNSAGLLGGAIYAGGNVTLNATSGSISFSGNRQNTATTAQANAIWLDNTAASPATTLTLNAAGHDIVFLDPVQNNAANGLVTVTATGGGSVGFDGSNPGYTAADRWSQVYGDTTVGNGTTFAVRGNAVYGALAADVEGAAGGSSFTVNSGAVLAGGIMGEVRADTFALNGALNIAGAAGPGSSGGGFSTFAVTSDAVSFGDGSTVHFNTYLNDASEQLTDLLVLNLNGTATSGTAAITVTNAGGGGGLTEGDGIRLVDVVNGTSDGAFVLNGDYVTTTGQQAVVAGAYAYVLYHGGKADPGDGDWYLRSELKDDNGGGGEVVPAYNPGTPLYESYGSVLLGMNGLPTLRQRVGMRVWTGGKADTARSSGVWGRIDGNFGHFGPDHSTTATTRANNRATFNLGADFTLNEGDDGSALIGGINARYAIDRTDVRSIEGMGRIKTNGYGLGATLTWYDAGGFYADAQAHYDWYRSDLVSHTANTVMAGNNHGRGYGASLELGWQTNRDGRVRLTPQVQLTWSHVAFDAFDDVFGALVSGGRGESLRGRLGLALDHESSRTDARGRRQATHFYIVPNLYYEFLDGARAIVSDADGANPVRFVNREDRLWGGIGIGGINSWNDNRIALFGEVNMDTSLDHFGKSHNLNARIGVRINW